MVRSHHLGTVMLWAQEDVETSYNLLNNNLYVCLKEVRMGHQFEMLVAEVPHGAA